MTLRQALACKARGERAGHTVSVMQEATRRRITWLVCINSGRWIADAAEAAEALRARAYDDDDAIVAE